MYLNRFGLHHLHSFSKLNLQVRSLFRISLVNIIRESTLKNFFVEQLQ